MSADDTADNLRRSKRNKYQLSFSSGQPERRRTQPVNPPADEGPSTASRARTASPMAPVASSQSERNTPDLKEASMASTTSSEEEQRRPRRTNRNSNYVYEDDDEEDDDRVCGMSGVHQCDKCPSRFETRPGLANHMRLHSASTTRRHTCQMCDFSCGSLKAIRNHLRCHQRSLFHKTPEVTASRVSPAPSDHSSDLSSPPKLTPEAPVGEGAVPEEIPNLQSETPVPSSSSSSKEPRYRCPECSFTCRNRRRYTAHMDGHSRQTGFRCHKCSMTSASSGFLKMHITRIHKDKVFPWPPRVVKNGVEECVPVNVQTTKKLLKIRKKATRAMVLAREGKKTPKGIECPVEDCSFICHSIKQLVSHKFKNHLPKTKRSSRCVTCGATFKDNGALRLHRVKRHPTRRLHPQVKKLLIREAKGIHFLKAACQSIPKPVLTTDGQTVTKEVNGDEVSSGEQTPALSKEAMPSPGQINELPAFLRHLPNEVIEPQEIERLLTQNFDCKECPFTTSARVKLDKHVSRHHLPSDIKCPVCTYSCRGESFMQQHFKLHVAATQRLLRDKAPMTVPSILTASIIQPLEQEQHSPVPTEHSSSNDSVSMEAPSPLPIIISPIMCNIASALQVSIDTSSPNTSASAAMRLIRSTDRRKKEKTYVPVTTADGFKARRCLDCPYVTKHSCDMSTHYQMHFAPSQRYKCSQCSYSTKRSVCLKSHYQLHRDHNAKESVLKPLKLKVNGTEIGMRQGLASLRIYRCNTCPFAGRTLVSLWRHARNHLYQRNALYRCPECNFFGNKSLIDEHVLWHVNELHAHPTKVAQTPVVTAHIKKASELKKSASTPDFAIVKEQPKPVVEKPKKNGVINGLLREKRPSGDIKKCATPPSASSPAPPVLTREEPTVIKNETEDITEEELTTLTYAYNGTTFRKQVELEYTGPVSEEVVDQMMLPDKLKYMLSREENAADSQQCIDCPYTESDEVLFKIHRDMHLPPRRLHPCEYCTFSSNTPIALHRHMALHTPPICQESINALKNRSVRKRYQTETVPPNTMSYLCFKCSARFVCKYKFDEHIYAHHEDSRRRLLTTIKRDPDQKPVVQKPRPKASRRTTKKTDKLLACTECSFRCETNSALSRHHEMHSLNGLYKCSLCSYSANTNSIKMFHEMNHHYDHNLGNLKRVSVLAPDAITLPVKRAPEDVARLANTVYNCDRCNNFSCLENRELEHHWRQEHSDTDEDQTHALYISFGLVPANGIATIA